MSLQAVSLSDPSLGKCRSNIILSSTDSYCSSTRATKLTLRSNSPIMGGFITMSYLGWRWTAWITLIMAAFFGTIGWFIVPETSHPVLHQRRARKIRFETKNWAIHSKLDEQQVDFNSITHVYLIKPFKMLFKEPILVLITVYMALVYGILYLFFEAYPISFQEERGWNQGVGALPFIGIIIGVLCGAVTIT